MRSPFTGGRVELRKEPSTIKFNGRTITFEKEFYHCVETGNNFTDACVEQRNLDRMWEQVGKSLHMCVHEQILENK